MMMLLMLMTMLRFMFMFVLTFVVYVYELFNHCIVTGWVTNPSLRITFCFVIETRSHGGQIYKTLRCKNKTTYFHLHVLYHRS